MASEPDYSRLVDAALTEPELDCLAYPREYKVQVQDSNGVIIGIVNPDETIVWKCEACTKKFASKQSLERHHKRFAVCKGWKEGDGKIFTMPVHQWAGNVVADAICGNDDFKTCKFCSTEFSTVGNFHKHFTSSVTCNRLAYKAVKEAFQKA